MRLLSNHTFATGGSNSGECWQGPRDLGNFLDAQTEESCTQYNVLKVARRRFLTSADVKLADFYEKAILNGLLGNQNRDLDGGSGPTSYIYMQVRSHTVDDSDFTVFSVLYHSTRLMFLKNV